MKTRFLITLAASTMMLAACSNDETDNWAGEIRLSSGVTVQQTDTRAATDIQDSQFDNNEKIDVYIFEAELNGTPVEINPPTYELPLVYTTGDGNTMTPPEGKQPYFPASGRPVRIWAIYPTTTSLDGTFTVQQDQSSDANYKLSDLMFGKPASNPVSRNPSAVSLIFEHLLSKVTITLAAGTGVTEDQLKKAEIVIPEADLSIDFVVNEGYPNLLLVQDQQDKTVTVKAASSESLSGSAILVPQTLPETFVRVTLPEGGVLYGKLSENGAAPKLESGKAYTYTITVNLTSLSVTSSITPWGNGSTGNGTAEME